MVVRGFLPPEADNISSTQTDMVAIATSSPPADDATTMMRRIGTVCGCGLGCIREGARESNETTIPTMTCDGSGVRRKV